MTVDSIQELTVANSFAQLPPAFYTKLPATPLTRPRLLHANASVAGLLGLSAKALDRSDFLDVCSGRVALSGGETLSAVYSGHQFGNWAGRLGDGRAHLLGEVIGPHGALEIQLKGSGLTPYSRTADGRAVVRSSVREYLASEAMAGLGIPTTRALAIVVGDDAVYRETQERAAIVARVSPTFVRFGSFEHWWNNPENMRVLLDYCVAKFYPECQDAGSPRDVALAFLRHVVERSARLVADWQTVGFCHGVMNTDNMSILGLTMDYGPYGFMDGFQIDYVCNHSDVQGRYAWNAQPSIMHWNLYRLASSLAVLNIDEDALHAELQRFESEFVAAYRDNLLRKFGWRHWQESDEKLVDDWWQLLHAQHADFTLCFRRLARAPDNPDAWLALFVDPGAAHEWLAAYKQRLALEGRPDNERIDSMLGVNPLYVLRNHLAEQAIRAAQNDDVGEIQTLLKLLSDPFAEHAGYDAYAQVAPDWACQLEVSCSS
jgi:uncharacterized protein YdiU (UPF0061 family)